MYRCAYQQKVLSVGPCAGEMRTGGGSISVTDGVVCPKPRRVGALTPAVEDDHIRTCLWRSNQQMEFYESKAGSELLDIILNRETCGAENFPTQIASPPPIFWGSPPTRVSNPVTQDALFGNDQSNPIIPAFEASPSSSARKGGGGGCVRVRYVQKPAAVRVEGFNCRGSCSISAVA